MAEGLEGETRGVSGYGEVQGAILTGKAIFPKEPPIFFSALIMM